MELKTVTGKTCFYQWDTDQILIAENVGDCQAVHFCRKGDPVALVCRIRTENDRQIVDVPNELLQTAGAITAYLMEEDRTCHAQAFQVLERVKPADYVYTQTEVLSYQQLDQRLQALEGEGIGKAVADYLKENPVQAGATAEEAAQIAQNKADIEKMPEMIQEALDQAKESGAFNGKDGYSPVIGTDYWTETDKKEMVNDVLAAMPQWTGGSF